MNKETLLRHMVYPRTKSLQKNIYEKTVFYTCNKEKVPDFKNIKELLEIKHIFEIIENNLDDFLPCKFDGFHIEKNGYNKYAFINQSMPQTGRTTLIQNILLPNNL